MKAYDVCLSQCHRPFCNAMVVLQWASCQAPVQAWHVLAAGSDTRARTCNVCRQPYTFPPPPPSWRQIFSRLGVMLSRAPMGPFGLMFAIFVAAPGPFCSSLDAPCIVKCMKTSVDPLYQAGQDKFEFNHVGTQLSLNKQDYR